MRKALIRPVLHSKSTHAPVMVFVLLLVVVLLCGCSTPPPPNGTPRPMTSLFVFPSDYECKQPPVQPPRPLEILVKMEIWSIVEISPKEMDMQVDLYVTLQWEDFRLSWTLPENGEVKEVYPVPVEIALKMWRPYVVFRNCKGCLPLDLDPRKFNYLYYTTTKQFSVAIRSLERFSCPIDLSSYPLDRQRCKIQMENYYEEKDEVLLVSLFTDEQRHVLSNMSLSEYKINPLSPGDCTMPLYGLLLSCVEVVVSLERYFGYYWMNLYAPTILIVLLSWISFWLPVDATPGRITLGVTSLLTLATRLDQSQKNLPPVSYVKAIDVWMFACLFLVFASLVEFAVAYFLWRKNSDGKTTKLHPYFQVRPVKSTLWKTFCYKNGTLHLDFVSRAIFPLGFGVFNVVYWTMYTM